MKQTPFTLQSIYDQTKSRIPGRRPRVYLTTIILTAICLSLASPVHSDTWQLCTLGEERNLIITAYYSPLPDQEHYALGTYEADIQFNGRGIKGSDGTGVYPGMIAAPGEIPFGTIIELPELGVTGTVHDRGGWINTLDDGTMRVDLWMGKGEEGLKRALAFGVQETKGILHYPLPKDLMDDFALEKFAAPDIALKRTPSNPASLLGAKDAQYGDTSPKVASLQLALQKLGYFDETVNAHFGPATKDALYSYQRDINAERHGERADEITRASLVAQRFLSDELGSPLPEQETLSQGKSGKAIRIAQRILKMLGEYEGDIDGEYDAEMMQTVLRFQKNRNIVSSVADTGAGVIGPQTSRALLTAWRMYRIEKRGGAKDVAYGWVDT